MATGGTGRKSGYSEHSQDKDPKKRMDPDAPDHVSSDPPDNPDGLGDVPVITKDGIIPRPDQTPATANAEDRSDLAPQQPDGMPGHFGIEVNEVYTDESNRPDDGRPGSKGNKDPDARDKRNAEAAAKTDPASAHRARRD